MAVFEIDVEVTVKRTLVLSGPTDAKTAKELLFAAIGQPDGLPMASFQKFQVEAGVVGGRMLPVESLVPGSFKVEAVRKVAEKDA
jgi:hypothetical protein